MPSPHVSVVCFSSGLSYWDASALHAAAQTQQAVSRTKPRRQDAAIVTVFQTIQQQTGCSFVYNTSDIDTDRKVTVSAQDEPLTALLDKLSQVPTSPTLRDKHVVLSKKLKFPHSAQGGVSWNR